MRHKKEKKDPTWPLAGLISLHKLSSKLKTQMTSGNSGCILKKIMYFIFIILQKYKHYVIDVLYQNSRNTNVITAELLII